MASLQPGDSSAAQALVIAIEHGRLARCRCPDRLRGLDREAIVADQRDLRLHCRSPMANPHARREAFRRRLAGHETPTLHAELVLRDLLAAADHHRVALRPYLADIHRLAKRD